MERTTNKAKEFADSIKPRAKVVKEEGTLLPSGSTVLNCALTDSIEGGFGVGKIINVVGESSAGKTMLAETCLAEIANNPLYDDYLLILDDSEHALEMDISGLFGKKAAKRIRAPHYDSDGEEVNSDTVEQFYVNIMRLINDGIPFIYFLDSLDTLTVASEYDAGDTLLKKAEKAKDVDDIRFAGSYGMDKAKLMSQILRTLKGKLALAKSTLVVISQVRDAVNSMPGQSNKKRAGGKALDFYCTHIIWLAVIKKHKRGKDINEEIVGAQVEAKVTKNKMTGKIRKAVFDVYYDYGIDDIGSCVDFLIKQGFIKQKGAYLTATELLGDDKSMYRAALLNIIEDDPKLQIALKELVQEAWDSKEEDLQLDRKPRFG